MSITPTIIAIIGPLLIVPVRSIEPDTLIDDLGLDGLDRQTIALELDEAYRIEISDATLENWQTIADIEATVRQIARETA